MRDFQSALFNPPSLDCGSLVSRQYLDLPYNMLNIFIHKKIFIAITLLSTFFLLFPFIEMLFIGGYEENDDILLFVLSQFTVMVLAVFLCSSLSILDINKDKGDILVFNEKYISKVTFYLATIFFAIFITFYLRYVNSISYMPVFAEQYRNGVYKGSGLYTVGMMQFLPIVISVMIARFKTLDFYFYCTLTLLMVFSFLIGLRVILLVVYFFLFIRLLSSKNVLKAYLSIFILVAIFVLYKIFLIKDFSGQSFTDIFLHIAGRLRYKYLVHDSGFGFTLTEAFGYLPYISSNEFTNLTEWKTFFSLSVPNLLTNMPFISLYSGLAWPFPLVMFNVFGVFGGIFVLPVVILFIFSLNKAFSSSSLNQTIWYFYLSFFCFSICIEDIYQFSKVPRMILLMICINYYFYFLQKVIVNK
jgi:hypothetical protein